MRTNDFTSPISSKQLNESMFKKFGVKVNFDKYDRAQLENFRNLLRTKLHQTETSSNFNALLNNESYQKDKFMVDLLNTRIKEMLGEAKLPMKTVNGKKVPVFAADGDGPNDIAKKKKKKTDEARDKMADDDYDDDGRVETGKQEYMGSRDKAIKKAIASKKGTKVKEGKASAFEMAHRYAQEYHKACHEGNLDYAVEMRDACESWGGKLHHQGPGMIKMEHSGQMHECGGAMPSARPGMQAQTGVLSASATAMEGKKLSAKQKKVMDKDHDDDIDAKDLAKLRKENMSRKQKAGITESIARYIAEDEEGKAKSITAGLDMVNDFTSWMQRIATYQTKSMIELSDEIRAHFGDAEAQRFKQETYAALEQSLTALTQSREQLSNAVSVLAGEAPAQEPMGSDPMASPDDMSMQEPGMEEPEALPAPDEFASADAAAGGPETTGRMKRESIERGNRLMKILGA
jgi:hypothetical protein